MLAIPKSVYSLGGLISLVGLTYGLPMYISTSESHNINHERNTAFNSASHGLYSGGVNGVGSAHYSAHQPPISVPAKKIAPSTYDISQLFSSIPLQTKYGSVDSSSKVASSLDGVMTNQGGSPKRKATVSPSVQETTSSEGSYHKKGKTTSTEQANHLQTQPSLFQEIQSLRQIKNQDGTIRPLGFDEFKMIIGIARRKLDNDVYNSRRSAKSAKLKGKVVESPSPQELRQQEMNSLIPIVSGRRYWPHSEQFEAMPRDEQHRWINGLKMVQADVRRTQLINNEWHGKVWPEDLKMSQVQTLSQDHINNMETAARTAWDEHLKTFPGNAKLGKIHFKDRNAFLKSHRDLREIHKLPLPEPAKGKDRLTKEAYKANAAKSVVRTLGYRKQKKQVQEGN